MLAAIVAALAAVVTATGAPVVPDVSIDAAACDGECGRLASDAAETVTKTYSRAADETLAAKACATALNATCAREYAETAPSKAPPFVEQLAARFQGLIGRVTQMLPS